MAFRAILFTPLILVSLAIVLTVIRRTYSLLQNYIEARKLGISIVIVPVEWHDQAWLLIRKSLKWIGSIPLLGYWYKYSYLGWVLDDRHKPHEKLGDVFAIVSPNAIVLEVNDPHAGLVLQRDYKTWVKPKDLYEVFDIYGPGLVSVNGEDWQRHRRIVNPAFREQNYKLVWEESLKQADQMLDLRMNTTKGIASMADWRTDFHLLAIHVLSAAGFGHSHDFSTGLQEVPEGKTKSFAGALNFLLMNILPVIIFGKMRLPGFLTWPKYRELHGAIKDFGEYMAETVAYTRATTQSGGGGRQADIASALIEADEAAKREDKLNGKPFGKKPNYLSDEELYGNLYAFNIAGFDTTAGSLSYAMPLLALNEDVQKWVVEELDAVFGTNSPVHSDYETNFPKLTRCLAVMHETIRLWGPLPEMARVPAGDGQSLRVGDKELFVTKDMQVSTNFYGIHADPRWWGPASLEWKPERWITKDSDTGLESINCPAIGATFLGWSAGPRICPGKKFSQVEFVATIATLLHKFRLKPLVMQERGMMDEGDAREALRKTVAASQFMLTTKMIAPENAGVVLVR
ncbi:cytochrome P450 [Exophiala viscosa]|uniref:cytochrome P450 n=1 Tax=Exophiala viscosa TaxID=2486360 RepID=UPI00219D13EA|nr:cytochrome P450 [Exophiala viscosa]